MINLFWGGVWGLWGGAFLGCLGGAWGYFWEVFGGVLEAFV